MNAQATPYQWGAEVYAASWGKRKGRGVNNGGRDSNSISADRMRTRKLSKRVDRNLQEPRNWERQYQEEDPRSSACNKEETGGRYLKGTGDRNTALSAGNQPKADPH